MKLGNGQEQGRCRGPRVSAAGAFDGFTIPSVPGYAVRDPGDRVYAIGFVAFVFLVLLSFALGTGRRAGVEVGT